MASAYIENKISENGEVFGSQTVESLPKEERLEKAAILAPILRALNTSVNQDVVRKRKKI